MLYTLKGGYVYTNKNIVKTNVIVENGIIAEEILNNDGTLIESLEERIIGRYTNKKVVNPKTKKVILGEDEFILVKDGKFSYRTKLDKEVRARIRAVFEDGSLCEAYIEEQFIPGKVLHMLVMDNQYRRTNHTLPTPE